MSRRVDAVAQLGGVIRMSSCLRCNDENDVHIAQESRYPIEPPQIAFLTKIYHPNIDDNGRICLDSLKQGGQSGWAPIMSLSSVLCQIQVLLSSPNPDDPLMTDIGQEYIQNRPEYERKAKLWTQLHAHGEER